MRIYKLVADNYRGFTKGDIFTEREHKKRVFKTIVSKGRYNYIIEESALLDKEIFEEIFITNIQENENN